MTEKNSFPLHKIFENLLQHETKQFNNSTAVWHVVDPLRLCQSTPVELTENHVTSSCSHAIIRSTSFAQLNRMANQMAVKLSSDLRKHIAFDQSRSINGARRTAGQMIDIQSKTIVALVMPPGIDRIVAQIACMKLHLAYLPLDRQLSIGRILQILELISPELIIMTRDYHERMFHNGPACFNPPGNGLRQQTETFCMRKANSLRETFNTYSICVWEELLCRQVDSDLVDEPTGVAGTGIPRSVCLFPDVLNPVVVVLFTSGSSTSGQKVVRLRQSQLSNRLQWQWSSGVEWTADKQWINASDRLPDGFIKRPTDEVSLASTACVFVDAFTEMFSALFHGIPVVIPGGSVYTSEACVSDVRILAKLVDMFAITRITTVPVQLSIWIDQLRLISSSERAREFLTLRTVVVSGDILLPQLAREFFQLFAQHPIRLLNFYGTTELAGDVTAAVFHCEQDVVDATRHVDAKDQAESLLEAGPFLTVGKPVSNTTIYIVRRRVNCENKRDSGQRHDSGSLTMVVPSDTDATSKRDLSILGPDNGESIDWETEGYGICEKGCVGEIAVTGLAVCDSLWKLCQGASGTVVTQGPNTENESNGACCEQDRPCMNFPGDLGFVCPKDGLLYICGRSDELVKINAVGFLAGDVDRLIERMKQACVQNPHQMSPAELKLPHIQQTVTIPIRHPLNKNKQLVCFYTTRKCTNTASVNSTIANTTTATVSSDQTLDTFSIQRDLGETIEFASSLTSVDRMGCANEALGPLPIELSAIIANYLPVYIKPIFVQVNLIPVMPTSGKIDKRRLRAFYEDSIFAAGPRQTSSDSRLQQALFTMQPLANVYTHLAQNGQQQHHTLTEPLGTDVDSDQRLEKARMVIANVLGLDYSDKPGSKPRPRDDEDFYILGGNSLLAVLALESLRQLGFKINLEIFYHTRNIGQILQSLRSPFEHGSRPLSGNGRIEHKWNRNKRCVCHVGPLLVSAKNKSFPHEPVIREESLIVREWIYPVPNRMESKQVQPHLQQQQQQQQHTFDDIVSLLVDAFDRNDQVSHAFGLSQVDLKMAASLYLGVKRHGEGIVLTASIKSNSPDWTKPEEQLFGALVSLPTHCVPHLPTDHRLDMLQKYFEFCSEPNYVYPAQSKTLTVMMVGIVAPNAVTTTTTTTIANTTGPAISTTKGKAQLTQAKWKRIALEILVKLERELLHLAQERGFTHVETLNTSETTKEVCSELGYTLVKSTSMQEFAKFEKLALDPTYHEHKCYHMIKALKQ